MNGLILSGVALCLMQVLLHAQVPSFGPELILNGDFEEPQVVSGCFEYQSFPDWELNQGLIISAPDCYPARLGAQAAVLHGTNAGAYMEQVFPTVAGQVYELSAWYANNPDSDLASFNLLVNGETSLVDETLMHSGSTRAQMNYILFTTNFIADSPETALRLTRLSAAWGQAAVIDGLSMKAVLTVPVIESQPESQLGYWGKSVGFSVSAIGFEPMTFQWRKNTTSIPNITNAFLQITNLQIDDAGKYDVVISNAFGTTISESAVLTVNPAGVSVHLHAGVAIDGVEGFIYGIQSTTDLGDTNSWQGETNVSRSVPTQIWFDPQPATSPQKYYRVLPGPIAVP